MDQFLQSLTERVSAIIRNNIDDSEDVQLELVFDQNIEQQPQFNEIIQQTVQQAMDMLQNYDANQQIGMTDEQIQALSECQEFVFKESDQVCHICLDNFKDCESKVLILNCSHYFHKDCIVSWLNQSQICPVCRTSQI